VNVKTQHDTQLRCADVVASCAKPVFSNCAVCLGLLATTLLALMGVRWLRNPVPAFLFYCCLPVVANRL
jgi:hypothetical protein